MSTLTLKRGEKDPDLSDKVAEVKSSFALQQEPAPVAVKKETKKTTTPKE
jgi:hypothetical protein